MICPDCQRSPSRLCPEHAKTDNLSDSVDTELERLREENRELKARLSEWARLVLNAQSPSRVQAGYRQFLLGEVTSWLRFHRKPERKA